MDLLLPDLGLILWTLLAFLIVFFILFIRLSVLVLKFTPSYRNGMEVTH